MHIYILNYRWAPTLLTNDCYFDYNTDDEDLRSKYYKLNAPIHVGFWTKNDVNIKLKIIVEYHQPNAPNEKLVSQID